MTETETEAALAELTAISSQVQAAVLFDRNGEVAGSTLPAERAARLASAARSLLEAAEQVRTAELTQLEAATEEGSLFVVRDGDHVIAAAAAPDPTSGLVFYDLKSTLRRAAEKPKPKPKPRAKRPKSTRGAS
jgi:predicted regulator of Ras-like GTPase activity (Roadblock/LC7/MglB family)